MKGTHGLNGRGLAILKSLLAFRAKEAIRRERPPFFVIPDNTLILLASNLSSDMADVPGLNMTTLERLKPGLEQAINEGLSGPPVLRPPTYFKHVGFKQIQLQNKRMRQLKDWRAAIGTSLSLDPSLLWPTASLERLAENPDSLETELGSDVIRRWQRENFALSLGNCLKTLH
jgi:ribonuclease D